MDDSDDFAALSELKATIKAKSWLDKRLGKRADDSKIAHAMRRRGFHGPEPRKLSHPDFIHSHFRRWRKSRKLSQVGTGAIFNVNQSTISSWERSIRSMPSDLIEKLAQIDEKIRQVGPAHNFYLDNWLVGYRDGLDQWQIPNSLERTPLEKPHFKALRDQAQKAGELDQPNQNSTDLTKFDPFTK